MTGAPLPPDPERERRRHIVRRATFCMYGFFLAAVLVAAAGAALVALLLRGAGLPFVPTWLALTALVLLVPIIGMTVRELRRKGSG